MHGTVLYKDKPAEGILLRFMPVAETEAKTSRPIAKSTADGTFIVTTDDEEGAPAGEYMVTMVWLQDAKATSVKKGESISMAMTADPVDKLAGKYAQVAKGFKVKIDAGANEIGPFKLQ